MNISEAIINSLARFNIVDAVDILLVAVLIYYVLKISSRTRAMQVLKGIGIMLIARLVSQWLGLQALVWVLNYVINAGPIVMLIIFMPELRRTLEHLGRGSLHEVLSRGQDTDEGNEELVKALLNLSKHHTGALVVVQRYVALDDIIGTGTRVEGNLTASLLESIFLPGTPLHDGAVIIKGGQLVAAGCFLPLTDNQQLPRELGTRHRAALGLSEIFDGVVFVVSEESGIISMAEDGDLTQNLNAAAIRKALMNEGTTRADRSLLSWVSRQRGKDR